MASNGILEVTDANFDQDVLKSEQPVLVDFWAAWCGPCRALAPIVDELAKDYTGKIKVGKMDVDSNQATPMRYGVRGIPTLLVFKGGQVKEQIVGYVPGRFCVFSEVIFFCPARFRTREGSLRADS
jgi:thioredoxin 1